MRATRQVMIVHEARCAECARGCFARNAVAWAHNHARVIGHRVELQLAFTVRPAESE